MRLSRFFLPILRETPKEAEIVSHRLMLRAGMMRQEAAGIYAFLPLGLRVLNKINAIVREEQNRAGAVELLMPVVQPAELWQETGRFDKMGPELLRVKDRHDRDFIIQPTAEEVITDLVRREIRSYRELPVLLYQFGTKFRDEIRPRFGLLRVTARTTPRPRSLPARLVSERSNRKVPILWTLVPAPRESGECRCPRCRAGSGLSRRTCRRVPCPAGRRAA